MFIRQMFVKKTQEIEDIDSKVQSYLENNQRKEKPKNKVYFNKNLDQDICFEYNRPSKE